jgi:hypothetical protein
MRCLLLGQRGYEGYLLLPRERNERDPGRSYAGFTPSGAPWFAGYFKDGARVPGWHYYVADANMLLLPALFDEFHIPEDEPFGPMVSGGGKIDESKRPREVVPKLASFNVLSAAEVHEGDHLDIFPQNP